MKEDPSQCKMVKMVRLLKTEINNEAKLYFMNGKEDGYMKSRKYERRLYVALSSSIPSNWIGK